MGGGERGGVEGAVAGMLKRAGAVEAEACAAATNWTAPYAKYAAGWWNAFEPNGGF